MRKLLKVYYVIFPGFSAILFLSPIVGVSPCSASCLPRVRCEKARSRKRKKNKH